MRPQRPSLYANLSTHASAVVLEMAEQRLVDNNKNKILTFDYLIPEFLNYLQYDLPKPAALETRSKYEESLRWVIRHLPHLISPGDLQLSDITQLKKQTLQRDCGASRVNSFVFALRKFLTFCNEVKKIKTINSKDIKAMKLKKREVIFLNGQEINQLFGSINVFSKYGLKTRVLMELLIASGMRISEALSLNRDSINWETKEATIIGKGDKQRAIFITDRAVEWLKKYLDQRTDDNPAMFVTFGTVKRLSRFDIAREFRRAAKSAGIEKTVTPRILRHSMATLLLHNGANLLDIQNLLGHSDIRTTAKYYLGTDKRALKEAHAKFLKFD